MSDSKRSMFEDPTQLIGRLIVTWDDKQLQELTVERAVLSDLSRHMTRPLLRLSDGRICRLEDIGRWWWLVDGEPDEREDNASSTSDEAAAE